MHRTMNASYYSLSSNRWRAVVVLNDLDNDKYIALDLVALGSGMIESKTYEENSTRVNPRCHGGYVRCRAKLERAAVVRYNRADATLTACRCGLFVGQPGGL